MVVSGYITQCQLFEESIPNVSFNSIYIYLSKPFTMNVSVGVGPHNITEVRCSFVEGNLKSHNVKDMYDSQSMQHPIKGNEDSHLVVCMGMYG